LFLASLGPATARGEEPASAAPKGEVQHHTFDKSKIFPGTTRDYWIYIPKQYDASKPACLYVGQDGVQYKAPEVFDDLIHKGEIPVLIGVFIMHGRVKAQNDQALDRFNRSYEYDGLGDAYVRFLNEEILPEVEKKTAADGRKITLSKNGNDRAIAGASSGAICAFTAAWERPESFARVFSAIGTYVGLRGGNVYPTLIRKYEPKPIRIFLQDGSNDLNIYGGDWWMANQEMERALTFAGYEVDHVWGEGKHSGEHATQIFPDAMRWLWKGWPNPIKAGAGSSQLQEILIPGEGWAAAAEGLIGADRIMADGADGVFFGPADSMEVRRLGPDGRASKVVGKGKAAAALRGRLTGHRGVAFEFVDEFIALTLPDGAVEPQELGGETPKEVGSMALSPDQSLLYVADAASKWVYSYQVQTDGAIKHGQKYYHLHVPDDADDAGTGGMRVDRDGRLYVATRMGIQVCDQAGRVNAIIPTPSGPVTDLCFGGPERNVLYAACGDAIYKRKVKPQGVDPSEAPIKPKAPRL
jgi:enterochelin esterase-like enzyme